MRAEEGGEEAGDDDFAGGRREGVEEAVDRGHPSRVGAGQVHARSREQRGEGGVVEFAEVHLLEQADDVRRGRGRAERADQVDALAQDGEQVLDAVFADAGQGQVQIGGQAVEAQLRLQEEAPGAGLVGEGEEVERVGGGRVGTDGNQGGLGGAEDGEAVDGPDAGDQSAGRGQGGAAQSAASRTSGRPLS